MKEADAFIGLFILYVLCDMDSAVAALRVAHATAGDAVAHSPQTPSKPLGKLVPRAPQTSLERVFRHAQLLRGFARRVALHLAQHERCAQERGKLVEILAENLANFRVRHHLLGS